MFKICIIGCGNMAINGHGPACRKYAYLHEDTQLAACCDVDPKKAEAFQKEFGFQRYYTDYKRMIEQEKPDVALVITPSSLTAKVSQEVLETKTNILLEKPPGINQEETKSIHECAERNGVYARVGFNRRYMPIVTSLIQEIAACGQPILHADCNFVRTGRTDDDFCTTAIHAIDSIRYIVNSDYRKADFLYQDIEYAGKKVTDFYMHAQFENSAAAQINLLPCSGCVSERIHVSCVDYTFFAELPVWNGIDMPGRLVCTKNGTAYKTITGDRESLFESNGFYAENATFFDLIKRGKKAYSDVATGIQSVEIADYLRKRKPEYCALKEKKAVSEERLGENSIHCEKVFLSHG